MKAQIVEVIRVERKVGNGTEEDPIRIVVGYWLKSGELIAEHCTGRITAPSHSKEGSTA